MSEVVFQMQTDGHSNANRRPFATFYGERASNESILFILLLVPREISSHRIGNCRGARGLKRENWHNLCSCCARLSSCVK